MYELGAISWIYRNLEAEIRKAFEECEMGNGTTQPHCQALRQSVSEGLWEPNNPLLQEAGLALIEVWQTSDHAVHTESTPIAKGNQRSGKSYFRTLTQMMGNL